jgi:hypothetical protein
MDKTDFLGLKKHARIKYIGTRPAEDLFGHSMTCTLGKPGGYGCDYNCSKMPKKFLTKGVVVSWVWDDGSGKISLWYYGGRITGAIPAEWELVDARNWVEAETAYKRAKNSIPILAKGFKEDLKRYLEMYKSQTEHKIDDLPIDKKLKIIMEMPPEDRKWFGIMTMSPEETIKTIEKAFEEDAADAT